MKNNNQSNGATVNSKIDLGPKLRQAEVLLSISKKLAAFDVLDEMLTALVEITTKEVNADRGTIFLNDNGTSELYSRVAQGTFNREIRILNSHGVAGHVFTSGRGIIVHDAYASEHFDRSIDAETGYVTKSILCAPIKTVKGEIIGVTQILNKTGGAFTEEDESRLKTFTAQVSIALENATLFEDVQNMKNYNESMLESMSNGVITLNEEGKMITCNTAGLKILQLMPEDILGKQVQDFFSGTNAWILEKIKTVEATHTADITMDADLEFDKNKISANITVLPLISTEKKKLGNMIMIEDQQQ